ncbi:hypothetical protein [Niabella hibiscisoli]|nr:hypothetical protein [Niabella hibiscisoli]
MGENLIMLDKKAEGLTQEHDDPAPGGTAPGEDGEADAINF